MGALCAPWIHLASMPAVYAMTVLQRHAAALSSLHVVGLKPARSRLLVADATATMSTLQLRWRQPTTCRLPSSRTHIRW